MKLPPPFFERPFWLQVLGGIVVPLVFGILTGFALGWHEILYYAMSAPIATTATTTMMTTTAVDIASSSSKAVRLGRAGLRS